MDPLFRVDVLAKTYCPQLLIYSAMHQDYAENYIYDEYRHDEGDVYLYGTLTEEEAGEQCVKHLLKGGRGHFGPLEHPQITFSVGYFPHSVMQQARTHRISVSFDCQSMRYTGKRIARLGDSFQMSPIHLSDKAIAEIESVFYLRPVGDYTDRTGKRYTYDDATRYSDLIYCADNARLYANKVGNGFSEEHARSQVCFDVRQHFVVSFNARSLMHFLDLRSKADAQLEIQQMCDLMFPHFKAWMPEIATWYETNRLHKARLSP
jgi:thymidylate synthase (FAD)